MHGGLWNGQIPPICQYSAEKPSVFYVPCTDLKFSKISPGIKAGHKDSEAPLWRAKSLSHSWKAVYHSTQSSSRFSPALFLKNNKDLKSDIHKKSVQNGWLPDNFRLR